MVIEPKCYNHCQVSSERTGRFLMATISFKPAPCGDIIALISVINNNHLEVGKTIVIKPKLSQPVRSVK